MDRVKKGETEEISQQLAEDVIHYLEACLENQEKVSMAVSGGSTPAALFQTLHSNYADLALWQQVHIFWVDERCVKTSDPESNFGNAREMLLKLGIPKKQLHPMYTGGSVTGACQFYEKLMKKHIPAQINDIPVLDLVLLGLGEDGHTASLFPGKDHHIETGLCCVAQHPNTGQWRISLSLRTINATKCVVFFVLGNNKAGVVAHILSRKDAAELPASLVNPAEGVIDWYVDHAAASAM
ncbi:MAG: 6-phosphogluconolactonase [Candidatus Marinimicrobia bacterium]|nr:6-phosphogluconolactonase [Candidatus Neomarinimicrobiota bacterium]MCF7851146.1 6-phosphogluconolactonase [Candidatus Neomarinimicrobiota bacterium]MCF7904063.1 6-phosphogluconolactonase [Candidatus Neomarinimicrobiota bacterium]